MFLFEINNKNLPKYNTYITECQYFLLHFRYKSGFYR